MTDTISRLATQWSEELPSHTVEEDQMENESETVLRSGNEVENPEKTVIPMPQPEEADNINTKIDCLNNDVLCGDDMSTVEEVVEPKENQEKLEDAITAKLRLEKKEEIEENQNQKEAVAASHSLTVKLDKYVVSSNQLPVTHNKSLSFILQDSIPILTSLLNNFTYLLLEEGGKQSCQTQGRLNLPIRNDVMDGVRKIHEIGVT